MFVHKKIKVGAKLIEAFSIKLQKKSFILLRGRRGYIMCGYLDLKIADKFGDIAVKIIGGNSIKDALRADVNACSRAALKIGISKNQPVKDILRIIA